MARDCGLEANIFVEGEHQRVRQYRILRLEIALDRTYMAGGLGALVTQKVAGRITTYTGDGGELM
ncbi:hypothetical protein GCM10022224_093650 [Nonomuraea antimicrobica]|uniref:Uncharacterized protein n=1 Tax=Nonomuraea antimicrobica TaxID=561173 RepID=A0ABP7E7X7_9ACTN